MPECAHPPSRYLLKVWLLRGGSKTQNPDPAARQRFDGVAGGIRDRLHHHTKSTNRLYIADSTGGTIKHQMWHLACFAGGMYAMAGVTASDRAAEARFVKDAEDVTSTCHEGYRMAASGLGPEKMEFAGGQFEMKPPSGKYILRPETAESYFYLWRTTHDPKYRDWAWEMVQAIERHCRVGDVGFSGVNDVSAASPTKDDIQQSFFLAETLKYLYLIFSTDELLPLDKWVFNTEVRTNPCPRRPWQNLLGSIAAAVHR